MIYNLKEKNCFTKYRPYDVFTLRLFGIPSCSYYLVVYDISFNKIYHMLTNKSVLSMTQMMRYNILECRHYDDDKNLTNT